MIQQVTEKVENLPNLIELMLQSTHTHNVGQVSHPQRVKGDPTMKHSFWQHPLCWKSDPHRLTSNTQTHSDREHGCFNICQHQSISMATPVDLSHLDNEKREKVNKCFVKKLELSHMAAMTLDAYQACKCCSPSRTRSLCRELTRQSQTHCWRRWKGTYKTCCWECSNMK